MRVEFKVPQLPESVAEATLVNWHKKPGDPVKRDENLIDIETDNIEAEVRRLEALGARRVGKVHTWCVMQAPTGQRFCLVRPQRAGFKEEANVWK